MKRFSLVKLAAALVICNAYIFCCAVAGTVSGSAAEETTSGSDDLTEENKNNLGGTVDFLGVDDITDNDRLDDNNSSTVTVEDLGFTKPTFVNKPVSSSYIPTSTVLKLTEGNTSEEPETSSSESELEIDDPYVTPVSSSSAEPKPVESSSNDETSEPASVPDDSPAPPDDDPGTSEQPEDPPADDPDDDPNAEILRVNDNGKEVSGKAVDIITKIVENEIGSTFAPEAIKAQAVTAYTHVKYNNLHGNAPYCILKESTNDSVRTLVESVLGEAIYYDGELIQAVYSASSAGSTASSQNVWGGYLPYLQGVYCELDEKYDPNYGIKKTFSEEEMKRRILEYASISLSGDPASWFVIENRVEGKYVGDMTIGGQEYFIDKDGDTLKATGRRFREIIMDFDIRSSAFDIEYDPNRKEFTFTTYGYGHGVGLSQNGANNLAKYWGWDYKRILTFYFQGTEVY